MIDEKKLREKLNWLIHPFQKSGGVPADLVGKIVETVKACEKKPRKRTKKPMEKAETKPHEKPLARPSE